jgi:hypothetical protein
MNLHDSTAQPHTVAILRIKLSQYKFYATTKVVELGYLDHFI